MTKIYNRAVFMPKIKLPDKITLKYTKHALRAAETDRYGYVTLPPTIEVHRAELVELEMDGDAVTKLVFRTKYNSQLDLVIVVVRGGVVPTVWLNEVEDNHGTLRNLAKFSRE